MGFLSVFHHFSSSTPVGLSSGFIRAVVSLDPVLSSFRFEVMTTPLDWRYITSIKFMGRLVDLKVHISPTVVRSLLGFTARDRVFKGRSIRSRALIQGVLAQLFHIDVRARDHLLRYLFLIILRGYFLGNNSSTVHF